MSFRFKGLQPEQFADLAALDDAALEARGFRRMIADEKPGFPCRITLEDAEPGERMLLINHEHLPVHSPYRSLGPIFVREAATAAYDGNDVPPVLRPRLLSLRAYDIDGMMIDADVVEGAQVEPALERLFATPQTAYIHVHNAKRGCFAALVERC
jgi:hypothetical protein